MVLKQIATIIKSYMALSDDQIWLQREKIMLPKTKTFTISLGFISLKPIGTSVRTYGDVEEIGTTMSGQVVIDIYGPSFDVVTRNGEVVMALCSSMSKDYQTANGFLIAQVPSSCNDISNLDGAFIPYRFQMIFNVQFINKKSKVIEYYDQIREEHHVNS